MKPSLPATADSLRPARTWFPLIDLAILLLLWAVTTLIDGVWLLLDQAPPAWDQGEHLTRALNYWRMLQQPDWLSGDWWQQLWRLSPSYRAPFVYLMTVPVLTLLGRGFDQAVMVNSLFTAALLLLVYGLGRGFDRRTGLWAAALCTLVPSLVMLRTDYLLDYGLVVVVLAGFACLTGWRTAGAAARWLWALGFGFCAGLVVLAKPTGILFLGLPVLWTALASLKSGPQGRSRPWQHGLQWILAAALAWFVCGPWVQANWLTILSTSGNSNATWLAAELNPDSPLSVWSYYGRMLPRMVTYPLLLLGLGGWGWAAVSRKVRSQAQVDQLYPTVVPYPFWLLGMVVGTYGLFSLLHNKDPRHVVPYVPIVVLLLVRGVTQWSGGLARLLRLGLVTAMGLLVITTLFPVRGPSLSLIRSPDLGASWPHSQVIDQVLEQSPYQRSTIGVLPNISQLNPMNIDFYGALADFQVFGREIGFNATFAPLDARSLTWVLAKGGAQGPQNSVNEAKAEVQRRVEQSPDFQVQRIWDLPDGSELTLYQRQPPPVSLQALQAAPQLSLTQVEVPSVVTPGVVPVTYTIQGTWADLQAGLLLVSWVPESDTEAPQWIHDHGIGLGHLYAGFQADPPPLSFEVVERLSMIVPRDTPAGRYRLQVEYVNRQTGAARPLSAPDITVVVAADGPRGTAPDSVPEPDLVSQLHQLSQGLATGDIDPVFQTVGRINQYDPVQDYLPQAERAMAQRLQQQPDQPTWLYTQVMAQVLQQRAEAAIATLTQLTQVAPENPYHWLFLGFVHLYQWQPGPASQALDQAETLAPDMAELQLLQGIAALQQLNLVRAWRLVNASGLL